MLKVVIALFVFMTCTYIGFQYGESYKKRLSQLQEILKGLSILQNYILYGSMILPESFEKVCDKLDYPLNEMTENLSKKLYKNSVESVYDGVKEEYEKYKEDIYLREEDLKILEDFFRSLGDSGVYGQEKIFDLAIENLKTNIKYCEEDVKKNVKLYRYLGACVGGMAGIFIL